MQRLAVYCGSKKGTDPAYADAATELGRAMVARGVDLVYGGGKLGMMGVIADAVIAAGGNSYGVIPKMLHELEVAHPGLTELHSVTTMHERKARMTELCDAFVALPGGIGTLDELFEAWTWFTLGFHNKPLGLLNVAGYWDALLTFLDHVTDQGFLSRTRRELLIVDDDIERLLDRLDAACDASRPSIIW